MVSSESSHVYNLPMQSAMLKRSESAEFFRLALRGGEEILQKRTATTMGIRFPAEPYPEQTQIRYEYKLYDGAAGIGIVLLDLYRATGDRRYFELCEEVSHGLVESMPEYGPLFRGLYSGFCGVALFHLACAYVLRSRDSLDRAVEMGSRLADSSLVDTDLFRGAAGSGLLQLALFHSTKDPLFLEGARLAAAFLAETTVGDSDSLAWLVRDPRQPLPKDDKSYEELIDHVHAGLAHGVAGICLFLVELARVIPDPNITRLYQAAFRWLDSQAFQLGPGLVWPRNDKMRVIQNHWCHGSAGIAHAYLALYRHTQERRALDMAIAAGHATWDSVRNNFDELACHCHGISGAIDIFLELANHATGTIWWKRALSLARRLSNQAHKRKKEADAACPFGGKGPGLGLGTAGVVRQLLRICDVDIFPILIPRRETIEWKRISNRIRDLQRKSHPVKSIGKSDLAELVPKVGIKFQKGNYFVVTGNADGATARKILKMISGSPAGDAYFRAVDQISRATGRLCKTYSHLLELKALGPSSFGRLLREVAGIVLRPETDPVVVRRAVRRMTANEIASMELMLQRIDTDVNGSLSREVGGRIRHVQVWGSDPHRGGQRVVSVQFEEGPRFLYKPRPVFIDRELAGESIEGELSTLAKRCREWLQPAVPGALLPAHRLIAAGPWHGYAEQINPINITTFLPESLPIDSSAGILPEVAKLKPDDEKRYWYSAGLLAGHAFTLGIGDLHAENVICGRSRSTPHLSLHAVDFEMAFGGVMDLEDTHMINGPRWDYSPPGHSHTPLDSPPSFTCALYAEEWVVETTKNGPKRVSLPWRAARWIFPYLVQNADGSFGYAKNVCAFLRGFADQWGILQSRTREISEHLRERLQNAPMRVVRHPTRSYVSALFQQKLGGLPIPGMAFNPARTVAYPLFASEIQQLENLDVPYFFRYLENEQASQSNIYWFNSGSFSRPSVSDLPPISHEYPFWSVVELQRDPNRLARAVVDIVWAVAPRDSFDFDEPDLGVRIVRKPGDERLLVQLLLGENRNQRMTCRISAQERTIEWWLDN